MPPAVWPAEEPAEEPAEPAEPRIQWEVGVRHFRIWWEVGVWHFQLGLLQLFRASALLEFS